MKWQEFESLVARVITAILDSGAEVKLNDEIPDPDNPEQLRQIDITIRREDKLTHVECRNHKSPQDVKWIEELVGRKFSLEADAMIAVSSSGFTKGAIKKAEKYGIFLHTLTESSVLVAESWGSSSIVKIGYYGFHALNFQLVFQELPNCSLLELMTELKNNQEIINAIFNPLKYELTSRFNSLKFPYPLNVKGMEAHNTYLLGKEVKEVNLLAEVYFWKEQVSLPCVRNFSSVTTELRNLAYIESTEEKAIEIIKSERQVYLEMDITKSLKLEANKMFSGIITFDFKQKTEIPKFKVIGEADHLIELYDVGLSACDLKGNHLTF